MKSKSQALGVLIFLSVFFLSCAHNEKSAIWVETVGELDPVGTKAGTMYYKVKDDWHSVPFSLISAKKVLNVKYTMRYNANNPSEVKVDYWNPIFLDDEKTVSKVAKITDIQSEWFLSPQAAVIYEFETNGQKIEEWTYLPPDYRKLYPNLKVGQYYQVECWQDNVLRSVLHLKKPVP